MSSNFLSFGRACLMMVLALCHLTLCPRALCQSEGVPRPCFEPVKTTLMKCSDPAQHLVVELQSAKDLYLVATYGGDSHDCDQAIWAQPTLYDAEGKATDLTTLKPKSAQTGYGSLIVNANHTGGRLSIAGKEYPTGFWAHAPSVLHFELEGNYTRFESFVGLDSRGVRGTVTFEVLSYPVAMPPATAYTKSASAPVVKNRVVPPVAVVKWDFDPDAAKALLDSGIEELVFIRRLTYNGNHIYTEYVNSSWMPGGGLCVLNLKTGTVREIVPDLTTSGVVGAFDVSFDSKKIVFDFKKAAHEGYRLYEVRVDGTGLRQLTFPPENELDLVKRYGKSGYHHGTDDMEPCYLPDGGIAFASTRCQFSVLCDKSDNFTVKNLYRIDGDGSGLRPLSYSALSEATPAVLPSGRLVYHRWEYVDKSAGNAKGLWSMNPDGTGVLEEYGNSISFPETMIQPRAIPGAPDKLVFLGASHCCPNNAVGTVIVVDTKKGIRSEASMQYITDDVAAFHHNGFHFKNDEGEWFHEKTGKPGRLFRNPYPLSESLFLVACKPKGLEWDTPTGYALCLLDGVGKESRLLADETVSLWQPYPLRAREVPMPPAVSIDPQLAEKGLAQCVVTNVYFGMEQVERGTVKSIRILEQVPRPWAARKSYGDDAAGTTHAHSAIGNGLLSVKIQHGIVPVEEDGSANFVVPANRPIYFQALDADGNAIQTERTYINYQPGEMRSCVGCHETPNEAPQSMRYLPKAMQRSPSIPGPQPTQEIAQRTFDYDRQIQPLWDKHCIECHGVKEIAGDLDLRGTPQATYSVSYHGLIALAKKAEKQLLGNRAHRDEDAAMNGIEYVPSFHVGALSSPLAAWLSGRGKVSQNEPELQRYTDYLVKSHAKIELSAAEQMLISNWLDVNCQYHPSYWGRLDAKFLTHPNYRPNVSFDEVRMRTVPVSMLQAGSTARP